MADRINWHIVASNLTEARAQLQELEALAQDSRRRSVELLEVGLGHAYHHLNCAWRARRVDTARYVRCTRRDFNRWGSFPTDMWLPVLEPSRSGSEGRKRAAGKRRYRSATGKYR